MYLLSAWIDSSLSESSHLSLWLDMNRFMLESYQSSLSRIIKLSDSLWIDSDQFWIDSDLHLGSLNCFTCYMTCINLHNLSLYLGLSFLVSESIQTFIYVAWIVSLVTWLASIFITSPCIWACLSWCLNRFSCLMNRFTLLFLCENYVLFLFTIYNLLLITSTLLNDLQLFSLGLKNSLFIHSSRLNTFS